MSKGSFTFKQFEIQQDKCAMKVCTDSCLFGATIEINREVENILDIGTGTGLLSLITAQKCNAVIDAVEIVENAANQASNNFKSSPWSDRLNLFNNSIQNFSENCIKKYDLIISNPPFFSDNLKSHDPSSNIALHNDLLSPSELLASSSLLLSPTGYFIIMLPLYEAKEFIKLAFGFNLNLSSIQNIKNTQNSSVLRSICIFKFSKESVEEKEDIIIKDVFGAYTLQFVSLLKDYYTIF